MIGILGLTYLALIASLIDQPWPRHTIDQTSHGADGVRLADINDDGRLDVVTGWEEGGEVRLYLQPERELIRIPWPQVLVGRVGQPEDAVLVDLDGDGQLDVVSCCEGKTRAVYVHWSPSNPTQLTDERAWSTEAVPALEATAMWMFAIPMDVDGRRGIDLVVGGKGEGAELGWLESPGDPRRLADWVWHPIRPLGWVMSIRSVDLDSDGDLDLIFSDRKGQRRGLFWLENPGAKLVATKRGWIEHAVGGSESEVMFLDCADLDGNGRPDILVASKPREILGYLQREIGWEPFSEAIPTTYGTAKAVAVGDIDLDGKLDVAFTCEAANGSRAGVGWSALRLPGAPGQRDPLRVHPISGPTGVKFDRIELVDLDDDGDLDLITCEERSNLGVIWYENPAR